MNEIRVLDLFSGIGGFSLGLKRAGGFRTVAYCEIEPYCQQVLQARMRDGSLDTAPICTDVRRLDGGPFLGRAEMVCGGFPCQDISNAGHREGIEGAKSGLWGEMARLVRQVRPKYVFVENVSALLGRGLERVLGDLAACGYDTEWDCIPACSVGAPHRRDRIWIVAYPQTPGQLREVELEDNQEDKRERRGPNLESGGYLSGEDVADPNGERLEGWRQAIRPKKERRVYSGHSRPSLGEYRGNGQWETEPNVGRVAHGVPARVDRLASLGNSVVPQVVEWIGRRIVEVHE